MKLFTGVCTALVTPYDERGIDYIHLKRLVEYQIESGVDALLVNGTTGEPTLLSEQEKWEQTEFVVTLANQRVKTLVGCGSIDTLSTLKNCQHAERLGADGLLVVTPYYTKTSQEGAIAHYNYIAENVDTPIILYNVPTRTGFNLLPETVKKLSSHKNITGIKDASGNIIQSLELIDCLNESFALYCGEDALTLPMTSLDCSGVISVVSNAYPKLVKKVFSEKLPCDGYALKMISDAVFCETNPIPIKYILYKLGLLREYCLRLPLVELTSKNREMIDSEMPKWSKFL